MLDLDVDLDEKLEEALGEICRRRTDGPYRWRKASMRRLASHGLVRRHPRDPGSESEPAWQVTPEGIAAALSLGLLA